MRVGLVAGDGGVAIWPLLLGPARAKQYLLTGDPLDAAEAERVGLVNRVVPADALMDTAREIAAAIAASDPLTIAAAKRVVNFGADHAMEEAMRNEERTSAELREAREKRG